MLYIILSVAVIVIFGILLPIKIKLKIHVAHSVSDASIDIYWFYGLIRFPIHLRLYSRHGEKLYLIKKKSDGSIKILFPKKEKSKFSGILKEIPILTYRSWLHIDSLILSSRIGVKGDPLKTVVLCGGIANLFKEISCFLFYDDKPKVHTNSYPDFSRKIFILNLEGIIQVNYVKIILVVLRKILRKKIKIGRR